MASPVCSGEQTVTRKHDEPSKAQQDSNVQGEVRVTLRKMLGDDED